MLMKIICFLLGHKIVIKAATGKQFDTYHRLYPQITIKGNYYTLMRLDFCKRCGAKVTKEIKDNYSNGKRTGGNTK
jgi:hypothetical protein